MKFRRFVSFSILLSFIMMTYSGILIFVSPKGRVANWIDWKLFGLSKGEYEALHVNFMIIFVIGILLHVYLNIVPIVNYFKNKARKVNIFNVEFSASMVLTIVFIFGTLSQIPPFQTFLDFEESVKNSWEQKEQNSPYGHAELSSISELATQLNKDENLIIEKLKKSNIKGVLPSSIVKDIAKNNGLSPNDLYKLITDEKTSAPKTGMGKKSLKEIASFYNLDLTKIESFLKSKGIEDLKDKNLKNISEELNTEPIELLKVLKKEGKI